MQSGDRVVDDTDSNLRKSQLSVSYGWVDGTWADVAGASGNGCRILAWSDGYFAGQSS